MPLRRLAFIASLFLLAAPAFSQNPLLHSAPPCADQCQQLLDAQSSCVAQQLPFDPTKGCFCSTAATLLDNVASYCGYVCSTVQFNQVNDWFKGYCGVDLGLVPAPASSTSLAPSPVSPSATSPTSIVQSPPAHTRHHPTQTGPTVVPGAASTALLPSDIPVVGSVSTGHKSQSWWAGHFQWIVMVIVLLIGFAAIIGAGIYFKRRYDRKHNVPSELPSNTAWGPNTSQFRSSSVYAAEESGEAFSNEKRSSMTRAIQQRSGRSKRFSAG